MITRKCLVLMMAGIVCNFSLFANCYQLVKFSNRSQKTIIFCPLLFNADISPFNEGDLHPNKVLAYLEKHLHIPPPIMILPGASWDIYHDPLLLEKYLYVVFLKVSFEGHIGLYLFFSSRDQGNYLRFVPPAATKYCELIIDENGFPCMFTA